MTRRIVLLAYAVLRRWDAPDGHDVRCGCVYHIGFAKGYYAAAESAQREDEFRRWLRSWEMPVVER